MNLFFFLGMIEEGSDSVVQESGVVRVGRSSSGVGGCDEAEDSFVVVYVDSKQAGRESASPSTRE